MIFVDRDKEQYDMSGDTVDILTDMAFIVLKIAEPYAADNHKSIEKSIDIVLKAVRKGLRGGLRDYAKEEEQNDTRS